MSLFDEIKIYLPKYLSPEQQEALFDELRQFPDNIDERLYTTYLDDEPILYQGDGLEGMPIVKLPEPEVRERPVIVLSNTCDISPDNERAVPSRLMYCPIVKFERYAELVLASGYYDSEEAAQGYLETIRNQRVSSLFYLPDNDGIDDSLALLDHINNCSVNVAYKKDIPDNRLFTLSQYGHYLFLFKLSVHLARLREGVTRY